MEPCFTANMGPIKIASWAVNRHAFLRQLTNRFEDNSPTEMKTVHRQILYCLYNELRYLGVSLLTFLRRLVPNFCVLQVYQN